MSMMEQYPRVKQHSSTTNSHGVTPTSHASPLRKNPNTTTTTTKRLLLRHDDSDSNSSSNSSPKHHQRPRARQHKKSKTSFSMRAMKTKLMSDAVMRRFHEGLNENSQHVRVCMSIPVRGTNQVKHVPIHVGASRTRGARSYMEDRHRIVSDLHTTQQQQQHPLDNTVRTTMTACTKPSACCFAAVYDGHNGAMAAQHASERMHEILANHTSVMDIIAQQSSVVDEAEKHKVMGALGDAFDEVEDEIMAMTRQLGKNDGCTALVSMVLGGHLFVANLGDSRAVLARHGQDAAQRLTIDHKPNVPSEKERIEDAGGKVIFSGCWRVAHEKVPVRLAVSRSFGDHQLKNNLPKTCTAPLVSAKPFVDAFELTPKDQFVILASDGIWDRVSDDEAVSIVRDEIMRSCDVVDNNHQVGQWVPTDEAVKAATDKLIEVALQKQTYDNVTAIVMVFDW